VAFHQVSAAATTSPMIKIYLSFMRMSVSEPG
jgi:hypothetical protein